MIKKYCIVTIAAAVYAAGVSLFLDPNALAPGGVTGISIILNRMTGIGTGALILILNIPILILGLWRFGARFIMSTVYCTVLVSFFTGLISVFGPATGDLFLAAISGGTLTAVGMGLVFKAGATTGGMDIIVKLLRVKMPGVKTGTLFLMVDVIVLSLSAIVFRNLERAIYAAVTLFISSNVLDMVLYGGDGAKLLYIISECHERITERILNELEIGVTYVNGSGAFSGREKRVILCVVHKNISPKVEEIVKEEDPLSFMIVTKATEIYGEGYKNIFSEKL